MRPLLTLAVAVLLAATSIPALAAECSLLKVDAAAKADLVVYFTRFPKEDETKGRYKNCRLVKSPREGTKRFAVTPFRQDASVVVHRSNWPGR